LISINRSLRAASIAVTAAAALATRTASGQPSQGKRAEIVFREGREAAAKGDMKTACAKFEESVSLARAAGPILNLADCEERGGRLVSAAKRWAEGLDLLEPGDERVAFAKKRAAALDKRLPRIKVTVDLGPENKSDVEVLVAIDGVSRPASEMEGPQPIDPGEHEISATAGDKKGREKVTIAEGERREVTVKVGGEPEGPTKPVARTPSSPMRTAGLVGVGVGVAGLVVFGVTGGLMASYHGVVSDHCNADRFCDPEGLDAAESGRALGPINTVGLIVGITGVAAGTALILLSPSPGAPAVALRAGAGPGGAWARVEAAF
jgi:hypothetical protein